MWATQVRTGCTIATLSSRCEFCSSPWFSSLSIYLSISLYLSLSIYIYVSISLYLSLSLAPSLSHSLALLLVESSPCNEVFIAHALCKSGGRIKMSFASGRFVINCCWGCGWTCKLLHSARFLATSAWTCFTTTHHDFHTSTCKRSKNAAREVLRLCLLSIPLPTRCPRHGSPRKIDTHKDGTNLCNSSRACSFISRTSCRAFSSVSSAMAARSASFCPCSRIARTSSFAFSSLSLCSWAWRLQSESHHLSSVLWNVASLTSSVFADVWKVPCCNRSISERVSSCCMPSTPSPMPSSDYDTKSDSSRSHEACKAIVRAPARAHTHTYCVLPYLLVSLLMFYLLTSILTCLFSHS